MNMRRIIRGLCKRRGGGHARRLLGLTIRTTLLVTLLGATTALRAGAQAQPTATVLGSTTLDTVVDTPLAYKLLRVEVPGGQTADYAAGTSWVFELSGTQTVTSGGETKTLQPNQGMFLSGGAPATFRAASGQPVVFLHALLLPEVDVDKAIVTSPATAQELYRTPEAIPGLQPGPYTFNLTLVTFPPEMPANPIHHRSGAALYYVVSGAGEFTAQGRAEPRPAGAIQYEPFNLVHQWANPGETPLTFVVANINPEGVPAVQPGGLAGAPRTAQVPNALPHTGDVGSTPGPMLGLGLAIGLAGWCLRRRNRPRGPSTQRRG